MLIHGLSMWGAICRQFQNVVKRQGDEMWLGWIGPLLASTYVVLVRYLLHLCCAIKPMICAVPCSHFVLHLVEFTGFVVSVKCVHCESRNGCSFYFYNKCGKCRLILIILSLLNSEMNCGGRLNYSLHLRQISNNAHLMDGFQDNPHAPVPECQPSWILMQHSMIEVLVVVSASHATLLWFIIYFRGLSELCNDLITNTSISTPKLMALVSPN